MIIQCVYSNELDIAEITFNRIDRENHPLHRYEDVEDFSLISLANNRNSEGVIVIKHQAGFHLKDEI